MSFVVKVVNSPQFFSYVVCILAITGSTLGAVLMHRHILNDHSDRFDD